MGAGRGGVVVEVGGLHGQMVASARKLRIVFVGLVVGVVAVEMLMSKVRLESWALAS